MVHLGSRDSLDGVEGTLELAHDAVVFTDATAGSIARFPLTGIRRAKRLRGSPVLQLDWSGTQGPRRTAFFFVQPPPLDPPETGLRGAPGDPFSSVPASGFGAMRRPSKRRQMRTNAGYLQTSGMGKGGLIKMWADEIAERLAPT